MLLLFARVLFILVLILPFEIRLLLDLKDIGTLPKLELNKLKGWDLDYYFSINIRVYHYRFKYFRNVTASVFCIALLLMRSRQVQSKYYSSFWVESLPVFWWCILRYFL